MAAQRIRQFVIAITDNLGNPICGSDIERGEIPMLATTFRQTREIIGEWRRRCRSRREPAMLGAGERYDLLGGLSRQGG
jgi:hypothetical protein